MILDDICVKRREQLASEMARHSRLEMRSLAAEAPAKPGFLDALRGEGLSCICEVKKASPSKGVICEDFHPVEIAAAYEKAGAEAISCLTEEYYFQGSGEYLRAITERVRIPVLRKDFIIDDYQIYEAKALGASAVLLIAAVLPASQLSEYLQLSHELGLDCLVEVHTPEEMAKVQPLHPRLLGINNRNLKTFEVNLSHTAEMASLREEGQLLVSESGIRNNEDMRAAKENGADAVLIGETLMRSENIGETLRALREGTA